MHLANYHSAEAFMKNATYFKDAGHLNDKRAHYYTSLLLNDLSNE